MTGARFWGRARAGVTAAAVGLVAPVLLAALWYGSARAGWLPDQILPAPDVVFDTLRDNLADGTLQHATLVSLRRVLAGFACGALAGLLIGGAMGASRVFRELVEPSFYAVNQVPHLAWLPLLILLAGIGETMKIVMIAWSAFLPIMLGTNQGVRDVPTAYRELGRALVFDRATTWTTIVLPSALPSIFTGVREGLANSWQALVIVELLASFEGIGYLMSYGRQLFQLELVLVGILVIGLIGFAFHGLLTLVEARLRRWRLEGVR